MESVSSRNYQMSFYSGTGCPNSNSWINLSYPGYI
jgi:hypothetical protein